MSSYQEHWELCIQSSAPILTFFLHSSLHCYKNIYKLSIIRLKKKKRFKVQGVASFKVPRTAQFMQALGVSFCVVITKIFFDTFLIAKKNKSKCRSQILLGFLVLRIKEMWKLARRSVVPNYTKLKCALFPRYWFSFTKQWGFTLCQGSITPTTPARLHPVLWLDSGSILQEKKNLKSSSWGWLLRFAPLNKHRRGGCGSPGHFIYLTPEGPFGSRDIRSRLCAQKVFLCPEHSLSVICGCIYRCSSAASGGTDSFEEGKS